VTLLKPLFLQPAAADAEIDYPGSEMRQLLRAIAGDTREGAIAPASAIVVQRGAGANFSVDVGAFQAIIRGDDVSDQGAYLITNTATANVVTPAAPGSGTRTHRLIGQVRDKRANGSYATYDWILSLLQDTGGGQPALPNTALDLASISISAGQASVTNANIVQNYGVLRSLGFFASMQPQKSAQINAGAWNVSGTWTDFSNANWPAITFTVPPSGKVKITISAALTGLLGGNNGLVSYRISGTDTRGVSESTGAGGFVGTSAFIGAFERTYLFDNLTPGGTDTVTPMWRWVAAGGGTAPIDLAEGLLLVEPVQV